MPRAAAAGIAFAGLVLCVSFLAPSLRKPGTTSETPSGTESPDPAIRYKGLEAGLAIYRKSAAGAELLPPHSLARPGDTLQVFYRSLRDLHGIIFSVDGNGTVTLHLPEAGDLSAPLPQGDMRPVPHAYLLDKAPLIERFYLVTSPSPFPVASVLAGVRERIQPQDSLSGLPEGFRQYSYTLKKADAASLGKAGKGGRR
jgi:hypothetical protein